MAGVVHGVALRCLWGSLRGGETSELAHGHLSDTPLHQLGSSWSGGHLLLAVTVPRRSLSSGVFELQKLNTPFGRKDLTLKFLECHCVNPQVSETR